MGQYFQPSSGEGNPPLAGELVTSRPADVTNRFTYTREQRQKIVDEFIAEKSLRSEHTGNRYRRDMTAWLEWLDANGHDMFTLMPWQMNDYARGLKAAGLSASTRSGRINAVSSFYGFLQQQARETVPQNPAKHTPRPEVSKRSKTRKLTADELAALRAEARKRSPRLYALVQLLVGSGVRITEALDSDVQHLRREGAEWYLYVQRKGSEDRESVQVPVEAVRAVRRYHRGRRSGPLFTDRDGKRLTRRAAANSIQYAAIAADIRDRNVSPHSLRHTATTLALDSGVSFRDVQVQMGHSSTETTARYDRDNRERNNPTVVALGRLIADDLTDEDAD